MNPLVLLLITSLTGSCCFSHFLIHLFYCFHGIIQLLCVLVFHLPHGDQCADLISYLNRVVLF